MIISEVPFFYYAEPIVKRFGILCPSSKIPKSSLLVHHLESLT